MHLPLVKGKGEVQHLKLMLLRRHFKHYCFPGTKKKDKKKNEAPRCKGTYVNPARPFTHGREWPKGCMISCYFWTTIRLGFKFNPTFPSLSLSFLSSLTSHPRNSNLALPIDFPLDFQPVTCRFTIIASFTRSTHHIWDFTTHPCLYPTILCQNSLLQLSSLLSTSVQALEYRQIPFYFGTSLLGNVHHSYSCVWNIAWVYSRLIQKMQSTICLTRLSNSPPLKCNVHNTSRGL